jgi:hypothetical protein
MANVTLRLDEALLREARVLAAREGTSVSRLVARQLERLVREDTSYARARRRAVSRLRRGYDLGWSPPTDRAELHDR